MKEEKNYVTWEQLGNLGFWIVLILASGMLFTLSVSPDGLEANNQWGLFLSMLSMMIMLMKGIHSFLWK